MKDAAFSDGIFSIIVGYRSRVSHNDRQDTDLLLHYHRSYPQRYCLRYVVMLKGKQLRVLRLPVLQE